MELRERRSELEDVHFDLETEYKSLAALREEREELEDDRDEFSETKSLDRDAVDEEIDRLQHCSQSINGVVSQLQSIVQFNKEMLKGTHPKILKLLAEGADDASGDGTVTDALLEDEETVRCWTCSSEVQRSEIEDTMNRLEDEAAELESESVSDDDADEESLLELDRRANELEFSLGRLERDLETTTEKIKEIESALEGRDDLEELRTRIDRIEREAVESFNEHMDAVLEVLEYENIDRIWIERVGRTVREGRQKVEQTTFDLHTVRSTADESTYEDTINHLSESEHEVTGLIFAIAGYLVHEVPFMLLDSLEAVDSNRIANLVEYFAEYTDFLVVALLPKDAGAIDDRHG